MLVWLKDCRETAEGEVALLAEVIESGAASLSRFVFPDTPPRAGGCTGASAVRSFRRGGWRARNKVESLRVRSAWGLSRSTDYNSGNGFVSRLQFHKLRRCMMQEVSKIRSQSSLRALFLTRKNWLCHVQIDRSKKRMAAHGWPRICPRIQIGIR
jgi:hypothetical protein